MLTSFIKSLKASGLSENTIIAYEYGVKDFISKYEVFSQKNLLLYKCEQMEQFAPKTVNLRIQAINKYLEHIGKSKLKIKAIRIQQKTFLENVISNADYEFLKEALKRAGDKMGYFLVRFMGATGARVSELVQFKVEHVRNGYVDMYCKGGKVRRLYIPAELKKEAMKWFAELELSTGYFFLHKGKQIHHRAVRHQLQKYAQRFGINPKVMHPHSFRHRYAKNFLEAFNDISLLADLMGHEKIETTRIYLRRSSSEQQDVVDKYVVW